MIDAQRLSRVRARWDETSKIGSVDVQWLLALAQEYNAKQSLDGANSLGGRSSRDSIDRLFGGMFG